MKKNFVILEKDQRLQNQIDFLNREKIHLCYFKYKCSFKNFFKSPILLIMKIFNLFDKGEGIDHVCHISRFVFDSEKNNYQAKVFEATTDRGMEENDLISKIKRFDGYFWIETLDFKVDKIKAKEFENKYLGVEYSKLAAALAGLDGAANKLKIKTNGRFCSFLAAAFLADQEFPFFSEMPEDDLMEMIPSDLFGMNLGKKNLIIK